jgi:hypothetical protein
VVIQSDAKRELVARMPEGMGRGIVIVPHEGAYRCSWYGMSPEDVARTLYEMADKIAVERCKRIQFLGP